MALLETSIKGTSYLIALQASSRVLTFVLNQLILRYTNPSVFGFATIQLELLLNTILFLCREGVRITVQRLPVATANDRSAKERRQEIVNLSYIPVLVGLLLSSAISYTYIANAPIESAQIPFFKQTVLLYAMSTIFELLSEPGYNIALHSLQFKVRASCEGVAVITRCVVSFGVSVFGGRNLGALPFAFGQLAYSMALLAAYLLSSSLSPEVSVWRISSVKDDHDRRWLDIGSLRLSLINTLQSLLKHVLTEGDKFMISYFCSNDEQGKYGLTANYGGLIARIIFQPVEEATRSFFSNLLSSESFTNSDKQKSRMKNIEQAQVVLVTMLRTYLLMSLLIVAVAPPLIQSFMPYLLTDTWKVITPVLASYMYYIPLLALNGILEAVITVTASTALLKQQGLMWIFCSCVFGLLGYAGRNDGAIGLVVANCGNLGMRTMWAGFHVINVLSDGGNTGWKSEAIPSAWSLSTMVGVSAILRSMSFSSSQRAYVINAGMLGVLSLAAITLGEFAWFRARYERLSSFRQM